MDQYGELSDLDLIEEFVTTIDVARQDYLKAVRQGAPAFTVAALGRLSFMLSQAAARVADVEPGQIALDGLDPGEVSRALKARVDGLTRDAAEALTECARQALRLASYGSIARICLKGEVPQQVTMPGDAVARWAPGKDLPALAPLRARLAQNAEDLEALRGLGEAQLDAGDAHAARLVFLAALERGGGPLELNLLGLAELRIGARAKALASFAAAAAKGLEAGRQNLASVLRDSGLDEAARAALEQYQQGRPGGRAVKP